MQKVFDYAGNEIKEGDEFVFIRIIDRHPKIGYVIPATQEEVWFQEIPDKPCFELCDSHKIIVNEWNNDELGYVIEIGNGSGGKVTCYNTISSMIAFSSLGNTPRTVILAIKGISDTKEYYDIWKQKQT